MSAKLHETSEKATFSDSSALAQLTNPRLSALTNTLKSGTYCSEITPAEEAFTVTKQQSTGR